LRDGKLTTAEAAKKIGIHQITLQRWITSGKVRAPKPTLIGAVGYRLWSPEDIDQLKAVKSSQYRKRGSRGKTAKQ
jgi:excisionase family DNA binding protein